MEEKEEEEAVPACLYMCARCAFLPRLGLCASTPPLLAMPSSLAQVVITCDSGAAMVGYLLGEVIEYWEASSPFFPLSLLSLP